MSNCEATRKTRTHQQQPRNELATRRGIDDDFPAAWCTWGDSERKLIALDIRTECAKCVEKPSHWPFACVLVAGEPHGGIAEQHQRRYESHHGAGEPAVDLNTTAHSTRGDQHRRIFVNVDVGSERAERLDHKL